MLEWQWLPTDQMRSPDDVPEIDNMYGLNLMGCFKNILLSICNIYIINNITKSIINIINYY